MGKTSKIAAMWRTELLSRLDKYQRAYFETDDQDYKRTVADNWAETKAALIELDSTT